MKTTWGFFRLDQDGFPGLLWHVGSSMSLSELKALQNTDRQPS